MLGAMEYALAADDLARVDGVLQRLDPRVKIVGLFSLIIAASLSRKLEIIGGIFLVALVLAILSRIPLLILAKRGWITALLFTGFIAAPSIFITPGNVIYRLPLLDWAVTAQGLTSAAFLIGRVETSVTLSLLLVLCTPWTTVLKALRVLCVPAVFIVILGMTYRYIFLLLQKSREMLEARQSRMVGKLNSRDSRSLAVSGIVVLLGKTFELSSEVYLAMLSRGFRGDVDTLDEFSMTGRDWIGMVVLLSLAALAIYFGR
ncbi:MAG: cobalt ECF transporter T component CbiQ [Acidobacteria bacterium]|nr:cobalt ECF transporter T component CbiQ [Acidobacteriota bacterium]